MVILVVVLEDKFVSPETFEKYSLQSILLVLHETHSVGDVSCPTALSPELVLH